MLSSLDLQEPELAEVNDIADIPEQQLRELFQYWTRIKGTRHMPARSDINPSEIVDLLPHITLIDVEHGPLRYKYRLVGTEIVRSMGKDLTGSYLDEFPSATSILKRFEWLLGHKRGYYAISNFNWLGRHFMKYHVVGLPLANGQGDINMILLGVVPFMAAKSITREI